MIKLLLLSFCFLLASPVAVSVSPEGFQDEGVCLASTSVFENGTVVKPNGQTVAAWVSFVAADLGVERAQVGPFRHGTLE